MQIETAGQIIGGVAGLITIVIFVVVKYLRKREQNNGVPQVSRGANALVQPTLVTNNQLNGPDIMGNQMVENKLQGNNFQGQVVNNHSYNYPEPYQNRINDQDNGWSPQGLSNPFSNPYSSYVAQPIAPAPYLNNSNNSKAQKK